MTENGLETKGNKFSILFNAVFSFSTIRLARIHDVKIGIIFRFLQIGILGYIIGLVFILFNYGSQLGHGI